MLFQITYLPNRNKSLQLSIDVASTFGIENIHMGKCQKAARNMFPIKKLLFPLMLVRIKAANMGSILFLIKDK